MYKKVKPEDFDRIGETREVKKFAWLPMTTQDNYRIWLEYYISFEQYKTVKVLTAGTGWQRVSYKWVEIGNSFGDILLTK
jgi:hypothetical protein